MTSKKQFNNGYILPNPHIVSDRMCCRFEFPYTAEYRQALTGHLYELSKWWNWETTGNEGDNRAAEVSKMWLNSLHDTLTFTDSCDDQCEDEDNNQDDDLGLIDGIIENLKEGGIRKAAGYLIDAIGSIIVETALKTIAVTVIGIAVGGVLSVIVGGSTIATVAIGAGEVVTPIIELPNAVTNIVEFVYTVAA